MKDIINLKEKHYLASYNEKTYAINGIKYPIDQLANDKNIELHPISKVGIINYNETLKVNSGKLVLEGQYAGTSKL